MISALPSRSLPRVASRFMGGLSSRRSWNPRAMTTHIDSESDLDNAIAALTALDPRWRAVFARTGRPPLRRREGGFAGLAQIIVGQQVSTASAAAIHGRLVAIADPFDHGAVLRARKDRLLRVGLSNAKVKTLKEIAKAIERQHIDLAAL